MSHQRMNWLEGLLLSALVTISSVGCFGRTVQPLRPELKRAEDLVNRGVEMLREDALSEADAAFTSSFEISPTAEALDGLGCVAFRREDLDLAREYFESAHRTKPSYPAPLHHLALGHERQGRRELAVAFYQEAMKLDPSRPALRNDFAALLSDMAREKNDHGLKKHAESLFLQATILGDVGLANRNLKRY